MNNIRLHPDFGLNPSLLRCPVCGKETNSIALFGYNHGKEAPKCIVSKELCDDCKAIVAKGRTFIIAIIDNSEGISLTGKSANCNNEVLTIKPPKCGYALMREEEFDIIFKNINDSCN